MRAGQHRGSRGRRGDRVDRPGAAGAGRLRRVASGGFRPCRGCRCAEPVGDRIGDSGRAGTPVAALRRLYAVVDRLDGDPTMPVSRLDAVAVGPARDALTSAATPPASGRPRPLGADDPAEPDRRASVGSLGGHRLRRRPVLFEPPDRRRVRPGSPGASADHHHLSVRLGAVAGLHLRVRLSRLRVQPADPVRVIKDSRRSQSQPLLVELLRSVCAASPGTARLRRRSGP